MPNSTIDIYSDFDAFSDLLDRMAENDIDAHRRFSGPKNQELGKLEFGTESLGPKDWGIPELCGRKKERCIYTWLRNRTSSLDFGKEIVGKKGKCHPIHINTNQQVLNFFEDLRFDCSTWLKKVSDKNFGNHRAGIETFYFAGNSKPNAPYTIVLIDIDCKAFGSLAGALAFAEFLKERFFPNLFIEVSTHGNGAHGFFVLEKFQYGAEYINDLLLHRLQPWLRQLLRENDFDVENVEIKGTLPVIEWGETKYEVLTYKSGTLAKFPRLARPEDEEALRNTTIISIEDLEGLTVVEEGAPKKRNRQDKSDEVVISGSITGKHITDDELAEVNGHYRTLAESLLEAHALETSGSTKVTVEDVAIWLMLIKFFTRNMNRDGSLPVKRWREMWKSLFQAADINRAFCTQRFSVIRDHISSLGLITWEDHAYRLGYIDENGEYHKGKACKWKASDRLMAMLELPEVSLAIEGEEKEASFERTKLLSFFKSLEKLPKSDTIRPVFVYPEAVLMPCPDEITKLITPFEAFTGLAA
ncbi:MAG: hypothetical protein AAGJ40_00065 [Planctomycetota bacterium]